MNRYNIKRKIVKFLFFVDGVSVSDTCSVHIHRKINLMDKSLSVYVPIRTAITVNLKDLLENSIKELINYD